eukprot:g30981.t1
MVTPSPFCYELGRSGPKHSAMGDGVRKGIRVSTDKMGWATPVCIVSFLWEFAVLTIGLPRVAATSIFTSGKYAIDPELRGSEFERLTQNLDVHFWKSFWNITETEVLASLVTLTSTTVRVNKTLSVPPNPFKMPMQADPSLMVDISPPVAHSGPGPVQMRLISYELRDGQ